MTLWMHKHFQNVAFLPDLSIHKCLIINVQCLEESRIYREQRCINKAHVLSFNCGQCEEKSDFYLGADKSYVYNRFSNQLFILIFNLYRQVRGQVND